MWRRYSKFVAISVLVDPDAAPWLRAASRIKNKPLIEVPSKAGDILDRSLSNSGWCHLAQASSVLEGC